MPSAFHGKRSLGPIVALLRATIMTEQPIRWDGITINEISSTCLADRTRQSKGDKNLCSHIFPSPTKRAIQPFLAEPWGRMPGGATQAVLSKVITLA